MRSVGNSMGRGTLLAILLLPFLGVSPSAADWRVYLTGDVGYSIGEGDTSGSSQFAAAPFGGDDDDVSPLLGTAVGLEIPMYELSPWRLPWNIQLPDWPVRVELEFVGLREYELETDGLLPGAPPFHTKAKAWTLFTDVWLDTPLSWMYKPITAVGSVFERRPRYPRIKRFLAASNLYFGLGIGVARYEVKTSESAFFGSKNDYNFAYQFGTGYGYQLTDYVHMSVGYRYMNPGDAKITLKDSVGINRGKFKLETDIHEVRFAMRINLYKFPAPWR